jgi:hypothetical protein
MLAFWLGGSCAPAFVPPTPSVGGDYMPPSRERRPREEDRERLRRLRDDEELAAILPAIWITLWHDNPD